MLLGAHLREAQAHWFRRHRYFNLAAAPYQSACRCPRALRAECCTSEHAARNALFLGNQRQTVAPVFVQRQSLEVWRGGCCVRGAEARHEHP
jgi:hypothetical protein